MEIIIGVKNVAREVSLTTNQPAAEVSKAVAKALSTGDILELTDTQGRTVVVRGDAIGFVEIGSEEVRRVGFATS